MSIMATDNQTVAVVDLETDSSDLLIDESGSNVITLISNNNQSVKNIPPPKKKEDEQITSAVMKVLQGYQWNLVPTTTK